MCECTCFSRHIFPAHFLRFPLVFSYLWPFSFIFCTLTRKRRPTLFVVELRDLFNFPFFLFFFTNRHNRVRNVIEKAIRNQSFETNNFAKGAKSWRKRKKRCTLQTWCQRTLQTHRKGRPAGKLTWCEPHRDHLEYRWQNNILQRSIPQNAWQAETTTALRLAKNVTLDMLWELHSIPHRLENTRKHKREHSGH